MRLRLRLRLGLGKLGKGVVWWKGAGGRREEFVNVKVNANWDYETDYDDDQHQS